MATLVALSGPDSNGQRLIVNYLVSRYAFESLPYDSIQLGDNVREGSRVVIPHVTTELEFRGIHLLNGINVRVVRSLDRTKAEAAGETPPDALDNYARNTPDVLLVNDSDTQHLLYEFRRLVLSRFEALLPSIRQDIAQNGM